MIYFLGFLALFGIIAYITNPFTQFTIIRHLSVVEEQKKVLKLVHKSQVRLRYNIFWQIFSHVKSAWHIVINRFGAQKTSHAIKRKKIIEEIHQKRFDPKNIYLISGDHFSMLYPRSMGIFYHSILDKRTTLSNTDWLNRQKIYLKTLAYALAVYDQSKYLSTTIVPITQKSVILTNFYAPPSDTLYSLLYAFDQLFGSDFLYKTYPFEKKSTNILITQDATQDLYTTHKHTLLRHFQTYQDYVYDTTTGLIRNNILLSGTKDIVKRYGAFYDNVIYWKTHQLAQKIGLIPTDALFLKKYKKRIITEFWSLDGFFYEDMSREARRDGWYSSDWLIAYQTGFLSLENKHEQKILDQAVQYIIQNKIDIPLPIRYHNDFRSNRLHFPVNISARDYGSRVIWSHWGMEYIKLLIGLYQQTKNDYYISIAGSHLDKYEYNILRYRGYPEVYSNFGDIYTSLFYKSVRMTGWVVSYEQAFEMYHNSIGKECTGIHAKQTPKRTATSRTL